MKIIKLSAFILLLILLDQLVKNFFVQSRVGGVGLYKNTGISFSLLGNLPWRTILPFFLFLLIGIFLKKKSYGLALIIAGGVSNLLDRFLYGGVVDFIDLRIWPVFNIADLLISIGSILLLIEMIKQELKTNEEKIPDKNTV